MDTLLRPQRRKRKSQFFVTFLAISLLAHAGLLWWAFSGRKPERGPAEPGLTERFHAAVASVTDLDTGDKTRLEKELAGVKSSGWARDAMAGTLSRLAAEDGIRVNRSEVIPAVDPERAREGRWDIRMGLKWKKGTDAGKVLALAFMVGEATLKSHFSSHRFWLELQGPDGEGWLAFETMDCRLYRNGRLSAADLLQRATWAQS